MIYDITDSNDLLSRMQGINNWIEENQNSIGNANMYEIISCMLARNNIRLLEGENPALDAEVERMITLRGDSIAEFQMSVPESTDLFEAVRGGLTADTREEMDFICKCQSVPFFINNARKRGFDGDITMPIETQTAKAIPTFEHDNTGEVMFIADTYSIASDEVKTAAYPIVEWTRQNSIASLRDSISISSIEDTNNITM